MEVEGRNNILRVNNNEKKFMRFFISIVKIIFI